MNSTGERGDPFTLQTFFEEYLTLLSGMVRVLCERSNIEQDGEECEAMKQAVFLRILERPVEEIITDRNILGTIYAMIRETLQDNLPVEATEGHYPDEELLREARRKCSTYPGSGLIHRRMADVEVERIRVGRTVFLGILENRRGDIYRVDLGESDRGLEILFDHPTASTYCYLFQNDEVFRETIEDGRVTFPGKRLEEMIVSIDLSHFIRIHLM
jgi:hypothetical protein